MVGGEFGITTYCIQTCYNNLLVVSPSHCPPVVRVCGVCTVHVYLHYPQPIDHGPIHTSSVGSQMSSQLAGAGAQDNHGVNQTRKEENTITHMYTHTNLQSCPALVLEHLCVFGVHT